MFQIPKNPHVGAKFLQNQNGWMKAFPTSLQLAPVLGRQLGSPFGRAAVLFSGVALDTCKDSSYPWRIRPEPLTGP